MSEGLQGFVHDKLGALPSGEAFEVETTPVVLDPEVCHARYRVICVQPDTMPATGRAVLRCWDERCDLLNKGFQVRVNQYSRSLTPERIGEELRESARESILIYACGAWKDNESRGYDQPIPDEVLPVNLRRSIES